jgi:hypothetical protein
LAESLAWGIAATVASLALTAFLSLWVTHLRTESGPHSILAILIGAAITLVLLWRSRQVTSTGRVALWIEERIPDLQYSLITALEASDSPFTRGMEDSIARHDVGRVALKAIRRGLFWTIGGLVLAVLLLYVSPSGAYGRSGTVGGFARLGGKSTAPAGSRLNAIEVRIVPPAYTGARATTLDDPASIDALVGSTISLRGRGDPTGLSAWVSTPLRVATLDGGWGVALSMPAKPAALQLRDRGYERVIVLAPRADAAPKVALTSPLRDTTLRTPRLVVQLNASASDDIGLADGYFEYLITTGAGEIFKARTITTPLVHFNRSRSGSLSATLDLASLKLVEGDIVSMRAIARDGNTLTGPGVATSDTRTIRIARASEYDSLSIEAAAPQPIDSSAMSQRMLVVMTEKLVRDQPKLARAELVKRSTEIGELEDRIRKRVHEILTETEEEQGGNEQPGEPPPTVEEMESPDQIQGSLNPDLKTAYNALWDAVRSLKIAEPAPALPPMRIALAALDRARVANRLYLRGAPPRIIVDIQRVRLAGKEKGTSSTRSPRSFADSARVKLSAQFRVVIDLIEKQPGRAMTELALMRVEALQTLPDVAAALGEVSDAVRGGRDVTLALLRARRILDGPPQVTPGLSQWVGGGGQ